jgi:hypothetical protein
VGGLYPGHKAKSSDAPALKDALGTRKARMVGSSLSKKCDVERLRRRRKPLGRSGVRSTSQSRKPDC